MLSTLGSHARHNVVGYVALFFALTGVAYAAGPLKSGDPAGGDLTGTYPDPGVVSSIARDNEIFPTVLANDGSASNLDADKLDGLNSTDFLSSSTTAGGDLTGTYPNPSVASSIARDSEILPTVLNNDGSGSNLDADKLDGRDSTDFGAGAFTGSVIRDPNSDGHIGEGIHLAGVSGSTPLATGELRTTHLSPNAPIVAQDLAVKADVSLSSSGFAAFTLLDDGVAALECIRVGPLGGIATCNSGTQTAAISPGSDLVLRIIVDDELGESFIEDVRFGWRATTP